MLKRKALWSLASFAFVVLAYASMDAAPAFAMVVVLVGGGCALRALAMS